MNTTTPGSREETVRIRKAMTRWEGMDAAGKLLGRGLGRKALIGRVAIETGTTIAAVRSALKDRKLYEGVIRRADARRHEPVMSA